MHLRKEQIWNFLSENIGNQEI